jgi:hypothetical protein
MWRSMGEDAEYLVFGVAILALLVGSRLATTLVPELEGTPHRSPIWLVAMLVLGVALLAGGVGVLVTR